MLYGMFFFKGKPNLNHLINEFKKKSERNFLFIVDSVVSSKIITILKSQRLSVICSKNLKEFTGFLAKSFSFSFFGVPCVNFWIEFDEGKETDWVLEYFRSFWIGDNKEMKLDGPKK